MQIKLLIDKVNDRSYLLIDENKTLLLSNVNLKIDKSNNVAYVYLNKVGKEKIDKTLEFNKFNIDLSKNGMVIGIEFLDAKDQIRNVTPESKMEFTLQDIFKKTGKKILEYA